MTFHPAECDNFIVLFEKYREHIRNADGCLGLRMLRCTDNPCVFFTYSHWLDAGCLDSYRSSPIFAEVWPLTKVGFAAPAEAWTNDILFDLK